MNGASKFALISSLAWLPLLAGDAFGRPGDDPSTEAAACPQIYGDDMNPKTLLSRQLVVLAFAIGDGDQPADVNVEVGADCRRALQVSAKMMGDYKWFTAGVSLVSYVAREVAWVVRRTPVSWGAYVEEVCVELEREVQDHGGPFMEAYARLKANATVGGGERPKRDYRFNGRTVDEAFEVLRKTSPSFARYVVLTVFYVQLRAWKAFDVRSHQLAKAVVMVAQKVEYKAKLEEAFERVIGEMAPSVSKTCLFDLRVFVFYGNGGRTFTPTMMSKLEAYLGEDVDLKRDLEKEKRRIARSEEEQDS